MGKREVVFSAEESETPQGVKNLSKRSGREELLNIYLDWLNFKKPVYAKYFNILAMGFMAFLIPFDFLLFESGIDYTRLRVLSILLFGLSLLLLALKKSGKKSIPQNTLDILLVLPGIIFNGLYTFYLVSASINEYRIVLIANFLVILFTTFFIHRFWKEQYLLNLFSILCIITAIVFRPEMTSDCILLIICHLCSCIAAFFYRREFVESLYSFISHQ
tara:strand:+ start:6523 stop:7176 length:654 start_codon:yes stop_codon:yes gene_type:complete